MPNQTTVYLPFSTYVNIRAFTNAAFNQRVTLTPETGSPIQYTGTGEHDTPIGSGHIVTPSSGSNPRGFKVVVEIDSYYNGAWQPSSIMQGGQSIMYYNEILIVSEDYLDNDWNDGVVNFTWWVPPDQREQADFP